MIRVVLFVLFLIFIFIVIDKVLIQEYFFNLVLKKFAENHEYSSDYNCLNYSKDLNLVLNHLGYKSRVEIMFNKSHAIVCVGYEPQTGSFYGK